MNKNLFESDSDEEKHENLEIQLNKEYAKSYNKFRQKELYQKLKDQDLNNSDLTDDESSSTDASDEENDPKFDQEFFKALSSLKSKDPKIYDKNVKFFDDKEFNENNENEENIKKRQKPLTLKDYERKVILEKNGKYSDDEDEDEGNYDMIRDKNRSYSPTYVEEEKQLKKEFQQILEKEESDEEFGGVFKKRQKTKEQNEEEEAEFTKWLSGQNDNIAEETKSTLKPLKEYWTKPNLPKQEKFLRDYILNKAYKDTDVNSIPTYDEIVGNNLTDDENELDKQEEFEHKYNFRYEEPDQEFIKRYPRTIDNSVRKTDDSRKRKRLEVKDRKQLEKNEKMKQIEILKEMKRQEIEEKIRKLKEVTGNEELPFKMDELDDDFDPDAHDRKMEEIFNEDYYQIADGEEKPECPDIDELKYEDWDNFNPNGNENDDIYETHCEDDDFNMDCDYDPSNKEKLQTELIENTRKRGRKRKNHFMEIIKKKKPEFNPDDEKTYEEYIDEYYKLDCEDIIGDVKCRFKYIDCVPNSFGLTIEEILLAKNKELNQWASLKKAVQIRSEHVEKNEVNMYKRKAQNHELKKKIFQSIYGDQQSEDEDEPKILSTTTKTSTITKNTESKNDSKHLFDTAHSAETSEIVIVEKKDQITPDPQNSILNADVKRNKKKKKKTLENKGNYLITLESGVDNAIKSLSKNTPAKNTKNIEMKHIEEKQISKSKNFNKSMDNPFKNNKKNILHKTIKNNGIQKQLNNKKNPGIKRKSIGKNFKNDKDLTDERLKAYGINPKKFNKKQNFLRIQNNKSKFGEKQKEKNKKKVDK